MALGREIEDLLAIEVFAVMEEAALRELLFGVDTRLLRAGDMLFRRGETADGGYVLTKGSIAVETGEPGRPADHVVHPIALLGESAMIATTKRPATAFAREPSTVLKIPRSLFHRVLEAHPQTALWVRQFFQDRLKDFVENLKFSP
ncbi:MAG: cyclic nucleotide-binding domain-containing protein [Methylocystis sp.]